MKIYDSLTKRKSVINKKQINIYSCGPTVYSHIHLGNARPIILMDVLVRYLKMQGYKPNWIQNVTDIDDKIINQALAMNQSESEIAEKYLRSYQTDLKKLNIQPPKKMPLISDYLPEMIAYINKMIKLGVAYESDGNVFFDVKKLRNNYGKLSKQDLKQLKSELDLQKNSNLDFALWKKTDKGKKWDSPWGPGRPGWHTECVVLINSNFKNKPIDIHAGGIDLQFPHHENERAQHLAVTGEELAKIWMHNGHLNFKSEKMSKSQGNVILVRDFVTQYDPDLLRWIFLTTNYRRPLNFTDDLVNQGLIFFKKINNLRKKMIHYDQTTKHKKSKLPTKISNSVFNQFQRAMDYNLNTPKVLSLLENLITKANQNFDHKRFISAKQNYYDLAQILNILGFNDHLKITLSKIEEENYQNWLKLIKTRDFNQADHYRELLKAKNLI